MADVEYDLDTSGGLMDKIQALLAPPTSDQNTSKNGKEVPKHPYYKRPGKGHNHDSCDACTEGGDLICCDKCPASFHLQCHDPPLEENDIPQGQWLCHTCRKVAEVKNKVTTNNNEESDSNSRKRLRNNRSLSVSSTSAPSIITSKILPKKQKQNPLEVLVQAASILNPKQFELPKELAVPCPFPGTDKVETPANRGNNGRRAAPRANGKLPRKPHELLPNGLVPLPVRTCFECGRSCRVAPLLACDYCPLLFHQDCLDPPLTALPTGRWMCPNHVEQYIDSKLVTSVSAVERVRLWDRFTGPIDQDAIKTEFIRKAHCKNPPFRYKVKLGTRNRVKVPGIVRYHYKHPVDLLPSLRDVKRFQSVLKSRSLRFEDDFIFDEQDYISERICGTNGVKSSSSQNSDKDCFETDVIKLTDNVNSDDEELEEKPAAIMNLGTTEWCINGRRTSDCSNGSDDTSAVNSQILAALGQDAKLPDVVSSISQDVDRELKQLDDRLIRFLAYQRLQQLSNSDLPDLQKQNTKPQKHMPLPSELLTPADIERISRVFLSPTKNNKTECEADITIEPIKPIDNRIRARAMLYPVSSKDVLDVTNLSTELDNATAMRYRSLMIGRGPGNHVDIDKYGKCNFVSSKHAVIFFDDAAQKYELINYSEHGTSVNNVLYTCDFTTKRPKPHSIVSDIVAKRKALQQRMAAESGSNMRLSCKCGQGIPPELTEGWEGTAIIGHGTVLKFGCVSFVFSITDEAGA